MVSSLKVNSSRRQVESHTSHHICWQPTVNPFVTMSTAHVDALDVETRESLHLSFECELSHRQVDFLCWQVGMSTS